MARARNLKPGFFRNEILAELPPLARLLFAGLWTIADKAGRLEDRPKRIKADVLPYDDGDVSGMLDQLAEAGFIIRYVVAGERYIQITNFQKHQNPHVKEGDSTIPAPEGTGEHQTSTVQAPDKHGASFPLTDSLNPLMGNGEPIVSAADATDPATPDDPPRPESPKPPKTDPTPKPHPGEPMPRNGQAQTLLAVLYEDVLKIGPPTNYGYCVKQADHLVKAGCTLDELRTIAEWLLADQWQASRGITITTIIRKRDDWKAAMNAPKGGLTVYRTDRKTTTTEDEWERWRRERNGAAPATLDADEVIEAKGKLA